MKWGRGSGPLRPPGHGLVGAALTPRHLLGAPAPTPGLAQQPFPTPPCVSAWASPAPVWVSALCSACVLSWPGTPCPLLLTLSLRLGLSVCVHCGFCVPRKEGRRAGLGRPRLHQDGGPVHAVPGTAHPQPGVAPRPELPVPLDLRRRARGHAPRGEEAAPQGGGAPGTPRGEAGLRCLLGAAGRRAHPAVSPQSSGAPGAPTGQPVLPTPHRAELCVLGGKWFSP